MKNEQITTYLEKIGIGKTEAKLYLILLDEGPSTVKELAELTDIKRTTAHSHIQNLISKGLVTQTKLRSKRYLVAEPPTKLELLIKDKLIKLRKLKEDFNSFESAISEINTLERPSRKSHIKYYTGIHDLKTLYVTAFKARELRRYSHINKLHNKYPAIAKKTLAAINNRIINGQKIWAITENSKMSAKYAELSKTGIHHHKFIPQRWSISLLDYLIFDDNISIVYDTHNIKAVQITNGELYKNMVELFKLVWFLIPDKTQQPLLL